MLDSLVRVSRRVGKASEAQAPQTGVGHGPRTPGTNSRRVLGTWRKPRSPLAQRRACTQGRTLAQRWSGPTPRIIPSGAGQDIRAPGDHWPTRLRGSPLGQIPGLRPDSKPNGSRRPTRGRSAPRHGRTCGTGDADSDPARAFRHGRRPATSLEPQSAPDSRTGLSLPLSTFRISPVYP